MNQGVYRDPREASDSTSIFTPTLSRQKTEIAKGVVPDVLNMGASDAVRAMQLSGMKVRLIGTGLVHEQNIAAGSKREKGTVVTLKLK